MLFVVNKRQFYLITGLYPADLTDWIEPFWAEYKSEIDPYMDQRAAELFISFLLGKGLSIRRVHYVQFVDWEPNAEPPRKSGCLGRPGS